MFPLLPTKDAPNRFRFFSSAPGAFERAAISWPRPSEKSLAYGSPTSARLATWIFPAGDDRFLHVDPVPQPELARFYAEADLFVLASREDGLGMVLLQALASGLPLICTDRTGGADLAHTPALAARITVVPHDDVDALACAIAGWRDRWRGGERLPRLSEADREKLSWAAYARRYSDELLARVSPDRREPDLRCASGHPTGLLRRDGAQV